MARKPRFTQYEMNRYVEVQNLAVTADSATGSNKFKDITYVPYTPKEIDEIVDLRKAEKKPLLTPSQIQKIAGSLGIPMNDVKMERALENPDMAKKMWRMYYNNNKDRPDEFGNYLYSGIFAREQGKLKEAKDEPDFCARIVACCDPRVQ